MGTWVSAVTIIAGALNALAIIAAILWAVAKMNAKINAQEQRLDHLFQSMMKQNEKQTEILNALSDRIHANEVRLAEVTAKVNRNAD